MRKLALVAALSIMLGLPTAGHAQKAPADQAPDVVVTPEDGYPYGDNEDQAPNATTAATCTLLVDDPIFSTHTVRGGASQSCVGVAYQEITTCVDVERSFAIIKYWASLGCSSDGVYGQYLSEWAGPFGYDYGTHRYRTRARAGFQEVLGGPMNYSPWVASQNWPSFTY